MMLDKKREAERLAKVYKETNKESEECITSIQRQRDNKRKRIAVVIIQKYTRIIFIIFFLVFGLLLLIWVNCKWAS